MKKKIVACLCIVAAIILLCPVPFYLKDGGTVVYKAVLYTVSNVHSLYTESETGYREGTIVKVLGIEIFNNVQ